jgi:iron(III) transport system permease protein
MNLRRLVLTAAGLLFTGIAVVPVALMFLDSVWTPQGFSLANYTGLLTDARQIGLLANSLVLSLSSSLLATLLGVPLGFVLAKFNLNSRHWWRIGLTIPLLLPPYILAIAWTFSREAISWLSVGLGLSEWIFSLKGAILVLGLSYFPIPMLITEAALYRVDARLEEAAWLVAGWPRTLRSITLPLVAPSITAAFLLVFVLTLAEFSVPALLRVRVFSTEVYTQFAAFFNFGAATAAATPLLLVILLTAILLRLLAGERLLVGRRASGNRPLFFPENWRTVGRVVLLTAFWVAVLLPVVSLSWKVKWPGSAFRAALGSQGVIATSVILSASTAFLSLGLGLWLGYWRAKTRWRWRAFVDVLWIMLFTLPGTVLGIGLLQLWNHPGLSVIYGTWALLLLGLVARFAPVAALLAAAAIRQIPLSLEESALVHGASWRRALFGIVLPNASRGLLTAGLLVFILTFGELAITILLIPAGASTLPLHIFTVITNSPDDVMASLCLLQVVVILGLLLLSSWVLAQMNRRSWNTSG